MRTRNYFFSPKKLTYYKLSYNFCYSSKLGTAVLLWQGALKAIPSFFHKWRHFFTLEVGGSFSPHPRIPCTKKLQSKLLFENSCTKYFCLKQLCKKMLVKLTPTNLMSQFCLHFPIFPFKLCVFVTFRKKL